MREIWVSLPNNSYPIRIKPSSLGHLGSSLRGIGAEGQVALVTNPKVDRLYGKSLREGLRKADLVTIKMTVPEGERYKTLSSVKSLYDKLIAHRFERKSFLMALGGGVVGDLAGFVAATYLRGIRLVHIPTTLVAQVDSSIGGKTGVDHAKGKNLIGSFYQPKMVYVDPSVLSTLENREFRSGLAEVAKYGVIADADFFGFLEKEADRILAREPAPLLHLIERCCEIKANVVQEDERESGLRRTLNFGHTIGHALETLGGYRRFLHGEAISIGMVAATKIAFLLGFCKEEDIRRLSVLLTRFGLPVSLPKVKVTDILNIVTVDKKVENRKVQFVLPERIGGVTVLGLEMKELSGFLRTLKK